MTILFMLFLIFAIITYRSRGPVFFFCVSWLISISPVFFGLIDYTFFDKATGQYILIISLSSILYIMPSIFMNYNAAFKGVNQISAIDHNHDFDNWYIYGKIALFVALFNVLLFIISIITNGIELKNLSDLRAIIVETQGASILNRVIAITTWACFFSVAFAFYFFNKLSNYEKAAHFISGSGIFLSSLTSAGRQSILQIVILVFFISIISSSVIKNNYKNNFIIKLIYYAIGILLLFFITVNRGQSLAISDRSSILLSIFGATINNELDQYLYYLGDVIREVTIETIIYVSHTIPLFSVSSGMNFDFNTYGALTFPFVFRQFEPLTGIIVIDSLLQKGDYINSLNVIGVGWDTGLSSPLIDFGFAGLLIYMATLGFLSHLVWMKAKSQGDFGSIFLSSIFIIAAIYMPFLPLFSDTSMFFLIIITSVFYRRVKIKYN